MIPRNCALKKILHKVTVVCSQFVLLILLSLRKSFLVKFDFETSSYKKIIASAYIGD